MSDVTRAEYCAVAIADCFADDGEIMGSPMGLLPEPRCAAGQAHLQPAADDHRRRGAHPAGRSPARRHPGRRRGLDAVPARARVRRPLRQAARDDGRHPDRPRGQPEHLRDRRLGAAEAPAARRARRAGQHREQQDVLLGARSTPRASSSTQVDIVSGVGRTRAEAAGPAATRFHGVHRVVSDLGVFDFGGPGHTMQFVSVHPGVTVEDVQEASSFEIARRGRRARDPRALPRRADADPRDARPEEAARPRGAAGDASAGEA